MSESNNFCGKCGEKLDPNNNFCSKCGISINSDVPNKETIRTRPKKIRKKGMSNTKKLGIFVVGVIILLFIAGAIIPPGDYKSTNTELKNSDLKNSDLKNSDLKNPSLTPTQIKEKAIHGVGFDSLMRNNEKYVGNILYLEGEVTQAQNTFGDNYHLRVSITEDLGFSSPYYSDPIYVNYEGTRVLEGDIVGIYGRVIGIKEYTAVLGNAVELPEIDSLLLDVIKKRN